jgi:hypothetical protein
MRENVQCRKAWLTLYEVYRDEVVRCSDLLSVS